MLVYTFIAIYLFFLHCLSSLHSDGTSKNSIAGFIHSMTGTWFSAWHQIKYEIIYDIKKIFSLFLSTFLINYTSKSVQTCYSAIVYLSEWNSSFLMLCQRKYLFCISAKMNLLISTFVFFCSM